MEVEWISLPKQEGIEVTGNGRLERGKRGKQCAYDIHPKSQVALNKIFLLSLELWIPLIKEKKRKMQAC